MTTICFITLLVLVYNDRLYPFHRKLFLIPNRMNKFVVSERIFLPPALISTAGISSVLGDLCLYFSLTISTSKSLESGTRGSAVCISVFLISLNPCTFNSWEKLFIYLAKILWESVTKSPFSSFALPRTSRLITLLKVTDAPIRVPDILISLLVSSISIVAFRYSFFP